jgi:hypothetical protein
VSGFEWRTPATATVTFHIWNNFAEVGRSALPGGRRLVTTGPYSQQNTCRLGPCTPRGVLKTNLILTSSTEATARTVDLFEIWDAELPFENVEVFRLERFSSRAGNTLHDPRLIKRE